MTTQPGGIPRRSVTKDEWVDYQMATLPPLTAGVRTELAALLRPRGSGLAESGLVAQLDPPADEADQ
ncbi:hypothetical protein GCM10023350_06350 [Nocardioides endophyticus]|uniref:Uncharacterized protein n=1 Tax=Nocardioides endophyticus TaxID=1353775 RepID=A0ABP8YEP5_9ACTN